MCSETTGEATPEQIYSAVNIVVLKGLEAVRKRPGMYVGGVDGAGLHNMVFFWVEDFALLAAKAGPEPCIDITLNANGSVTVEHCGDSLSTAPHPREGASVAEATMTTLHCSKYFMVAVVNALSARLDLLIWDGGNQYSLAYENGEPLHPLKLLGSSAGKSGVCVTFLPSAEIFTMRAFDYVTLEERFRDLAFLNPGVRITLRDQRGRQPKSTVLRSRQGLADFVRYLDRTNETLLTSPITITGTRDDVTVEAALQWNTGRAESFMAFTNQMRQRLGGAHCAGLRAAVTQVFDNGLSGGSVALGGACEGLTYVLSVKADQTHYADATRDELASPEIGDAVKDIVAAALTAWISEHPTEAGRVRQKIADAANSLGGR